jgi:sugar-specific transcriptional regulator TrmB
MARKGGTPDNLIPAKKGEVRNPHGRPIGSRNRETIVNKWLELIKDAENPITGELEKLPISDQMVLTLIGKVLTEADVPAFKELMDSAYGKIIDKQKIEHSGEININPITWVKSGSDGD